VAVQARDNALLMLPGGTSPPGTRYSAAPGGSPGTVDGHVLEPTGEGRGKLIVGPFGVSLAQGLHFATVKFAECQLVNAWPDGARQLIGADGISLHVDPAQWQGGYIAPGIIDANVSPAVVLIQPARPGKPTPPAPEPVAAQAQQRRGLFRRR
jgi:zinc protease